MQENILINFNMKQKEIQHKEISEAYTTAKDMLTNYSAYMDENEKLGWYKVMKENHAFHILVNVCTSIS